MAGARPGRRAAVVLACAALALTRAAGAPPDPAGGTGGAPLAGTLTVRVVDARTAAPIPGAFVMTGSAEGVPFAGNVRITDTTGTAVFTHASLTGAIDVTAGAAGYGYATIFDLPADALVLPLRPIAPPSTALIGDDFAGIEINNGFLCLGDGNLDFGVAVPAIPVERAISEGALTAFSPTEGAFITPQGVVPVFDNLFAPRQCEAGAFFEKLSWHLRVETGPLTLFGLTMRVPLSALASANDFLDVIRASTFREMDILRNRVVTTSSNAFDLNADLALSPNLTVQIGNGRPATSVLAAAAGRIRNSGGEELLITTGLDGFDPDLHGPSATLTLETRPAIGELPDLIPGAFVTQSGDLPPIGVRGSTTAVVRSGFTPPATLSFTSFYDIVTLASPDDTTFSWTDVIVPTSPAVVDLNVGRLIHVTRVPNPDDPNDTILDRRTFWTLHSPGVRHTITLPALPSAAVVSIPDPDATPAPDRLELDHAVWRLGDDPDGFDYSGFAFADVARFGTHLSRNDLPLRCDTTVEITGLTVTHGPMAGEITLTWNPDDHPCLDHASGRPYEVHAATTARPASPPGTWPTDPPFTRVTDEDLDGTSADAAFTHVPPAGAIVYYLVTGRGTSGRDGPVGHYGR